jgi:hypothetical protein
MCRETTEEYSREVASLCGRLTAAMSLGLGAGESRLAEAFGGADAAGVCVRVNYYPRCPQPELTLGLSSHSDPGGMTVLLPDDRVRGLQVRRRGAWVTVDPVPDAFIVNVGDQIQVRYLKTCALYCITVLFFDCSIATVHTYFSLTLVFLRPRFFLFRDGGRAHMHVIL